MSFGCTVAECAQLEEDSRGFCALHLRRWIEGLVYEEEDGELYDHCRRGHILAGENLRWESSGKGGKRRRRCRQCLRDKARRLSGAQLPEVEVPKPYRPDDETLTQAILDFEEAQTRITAKCKGKPGPYMDWDEPPAPEEAEEMCRGCPLLKACENFAIASRQTHGVWGGKVIHEGKWLS